MRVRRAPVVARARGSRGAGRGGRDAADRASRWCARPQAWPTSSTWWQGSVSSSGTVIALVFLTIVNLLVFTPAAFVMWLCRYDPGAGRASTRPVVLERARRSVAPEAAVQRRAGATTRQSARCDRGRRPILRLATVVGVVTLLLAADLGGGWLYEQVSDETHGSTAVADDSFEPSTQPAFPRQPRGRRPCWPSSRICPAYRGRVPRLPPRRLGVATPTNVADGERLSYRPAGSGRRVSVWFFGGSALFG